MMRFAASRPGVLRRRLARREISKRAFDLGLAIFLLPVILPFIIVLSLFAMLDGGPAFFGQMRVGRGGRLFRCWKIRTMVVDAEARLARHLKDDPEAAAEWRAYRKLSADPRITRLGRFMRETSLDELPQIFNVLRGEMSFVGPRPVVEPEMEEYRGYEWAYKSVRPGITGLWQVSGRNDVSYAERVALDVRYARSRSLKLDLVIIVRTAGAVLNRTGR
jgi:lipopolysaccharide/colanic/teichoic acid biosynthesis glycosyltransferase